MRTLAVLLLLTIVAWFLLLGVGRLLVVLRQSVNESERRRLAVNRILRLVSPGGQLGRALFAPEGSKPSFRRRIGWAILLGASFFFYLVATALNDSYLLYDGETTWWVLTITFWAMIAGFWLRQRRKRVVVFLRKFGHSEANNFFAAALTRHLRSRYCVVTLEDQSFPRVRARLRDVVWPIAAALAILGLGLAFAFSFLQIIKTEFGFPGTYFLLLGQPFVQIRLGRLALAIALAVMAFANYVALTMIVSAVRSALTSRRNVRTLRDIRRCESFIRRLPELAVAPGIGRPASSVYRVTDELWQQAVVRIVASCDVVVLDVSRPSSGIAWELEYCQKLSPPKSVFLAGEASWASWQTERNVPAAFTALDRNSVLLYQGLGENMAALTGRMNDLVARNPKSAAASSRWRLAGRIAFMLFAYYVGILLASIPGELLLSELKQALHLE